MVTIEARREGLGGRRPGCPAPSLSGVVVVQSDGEIESLLSPLPTAENPPPTVAVRPPSPRPLEV